MPTSVRLDLKSEALLRRLARKSGRSKSAILREAVARLAAADQSADYGGSVHDLVADLVGVARGGPADLARRHREAFREQLARPRRK
jgi:hypothetical protein